ncbi:Detected protein of confused Function [Hibiscus syriacus]|uniref:Purple acid phosphatase n=1 Tax=Hibiscus syriacus TaxID=106335 RepID=A0A6A2XUL3_HIBSY|nr:Detected protein of confused Function [Hibiscus syriacus]
MFQTLNKCSTGDCLGSKSFYVQTGDISDLPLLCHYPVKAIYASSDPDYLSCEKKECRKYNENGRCEIRTCSATVTFYVINIRTDIEFVFFAGGFLTPCILRRTLPFQFSNPTAPLYGHLSTFDSSGTSMRLTWISGDSKPQRVNYRNGKSQISEVTTFSQEDMCMMTGLQPSTISNYKYGSDAVGWSKEIEFHTPPAGGSDERNFFIFGDMGKAPFDASIEHYIQPGSVSVVKAMEGEIKNGSIDSIFHIGDISYATGFPVEWEFFLNLISPLAFTVSYMTAIENHERDYAGSGDHYLNEDSGGECGVPHETYFQMPTAAKDKPWYAIEQGPVHFAHQWMTKDMASIDRSKTPWLIFTGTLGNVDDSFRNVVEPVLANKVDLVLFGHVHNYERTCSISNCQCLAMPEKDENGVDTYDNGNYKAPVHAIVGMAGFSIQKFSPFVSDWSLIRISEYGYVRAHATRNELMLEFVNSTSRSVIDSFHITKN